MQVKVVKPKTESSVNLTDLNTTDTNHTKTEIDEPGPGKLSYLYHPCVKAILAILCVGVIVAIIALCVVFINKHPKLKSFIDNNKLALYPEPTKGVNLAGWLVYEDWILKPTQLYNHGVEVSPLVPFANSFKDEYELGVAASTNATIRSLVVKHWNDFVTLQDLQILKLYGISHLRIPIPYWIFSNFSELSSYNETYNTGGLFYLNRVVEWANALDMKIILSLHCAPGRQNPWSHSGKTNDTQFGTVATIARTVDILKRMSLQIREWENWYNNTIIGVSLLNEPTFWLYPNTLWSLISYYEQGIVAVRNYLPAERYAVIFDITFAQVSDFWFFEGKYENTYYDKHIFHCLNQDYDNFNTSQEHIDVICGIDRPWLMNQSWTQDSVVSPQLIVGEFSICYQSEIENNVNDYNMLLNAYLYGFKSARIGSWYYFNFKTQSQPVWDFEYLFGLKLVSYQDDNGCQTANFK